MGDKPTKLSTAKIWQRDMMQAWRTVPVFFMSTDVDMSRCIALRKSVPKGSVRPSYTQMIIKASGDVLADHLKLHVTVAQNRVYSPEDVDILFAVASDVDNVAPSIVVRAVNRKTLGEIAAEVEARRDEGLRDLRKTDELLNRWGKLVPFAFLRRAIIRFIMSRFEWRRHFIGTFWVTVVPGPIYGGNLMFATSAMLCAGGLQEKAVVVNHEIVIRPMMTLTCTADHRVWNGATALRFLNKVKHRLESGLFESGSVELADSATATDSAGI
jgi:pyruvate dehydrogenase E2 component (dihydrolipoamide acetyltransferase)